MSDYEILSTVLGPLSFDKRQTILETLTMYPELFAAFIQISRKKIAATQWPDPKKFEDIFDSEKKFLQKLISEE